VRLVYNKFLKFAETIKQLTLKPLVHGRIFYENHWLFKVSEITETGTSSIPICFPSTKTFSDSEIIFKLLVVVLIQIIAKH
jgi:hypothetical protein